MSWDVLVRHGLIIDGSGRPGAMGDIALRGDRIAGLGVSLIGHAKKIIDAEGLAAAPGFIDIKTHSDFVLPINPKAESKVRQGVTTEIVGHCGFSVAPVLPGKAQLLADYLSGGAPWLPFRELSFPEYLDTFAAVAVNTGMLVGHNTLRLMVMGLEDRAPTELELNKMIALLEDGLQAGALGMPFLLGDALSFIFWPYAYYDPFWWYGSPFIFASIFAPGPYFGLDYGYGPDYYGYGYGTGYYGYAGSPNIYYDSSRSGGHNTTARGQYAAGTEQADRQALVETNTAALESCTGLAPGVTNLPIDQIRQTVHPTADQEAALDDLSAASSQASDIIKSSCPTSVPLTPIGRLDAAGQRLDATIKAIQIVRSPLERFYQALSDEQRQRFNAMNGPTESAPSAGNMVTACSQQGGGFIDLPVQRIEQVVQPSAQQQSAFNDLKKAAQKASDQLQSSCPTAVPKSPVARVDTVETRLAAMADAIKSVRPDLQNFYASLSDEQKAKFNTMGPPPQATSSPQQRQNGGQQ